MAYILSQARRLLARDPRDVLTFAIRRIPRIPRNLFEGMRARMTSIPSGVKPHPSTPDTIDAMIRWKPITLSDKVVEAGRRTLDGEGVKLLGSEFKVGWPIEWSHPSFGVWESGPSTGISYYGKKVEQDIKYIWELQRQQYLPAVAASLKEGEEEEFIDQLLEWGVLHPPFRTVAWMEGIEVSLRLISWIDSLSRLTQNPTQEKLSKIGSLLSFHGVWLEKHLSRKWRVNNNHLLLELIGLTVIGHVAHWHPRSSKWRAIGLSTLLSELQSQTTQGRNWEPTTAYHRFVTEGLLIAQKSWREAAIERDASLHERLDDFVAQHVDTLCWLCDLKGNIPLVGDDDAGIIIPRTRNWSVCDAKPTLQLAEDCGHNLTELQGTICWSDQGMGVFRKGAFHVHLVAGAPKGIRRQGSHRHLDMLSCSVSVEGKPVLIDPGTLTYFGGKAWRDHFRTGRVHPGIWSIEREWANLTNLFEVPKPPIGEIVAEDDSLKATCCIGKNIFAKRDVQVIDGELVITDKGNLPSPVWSFPVPHDSSWEITDETLTILGCGFKLTHKPVMGKVRCIEGVVLRDWKSDNGWIRHPVVDGTISLGYGGLSAGRRVEVEGDFSTPRMTCISASDE